MWACPDGASCPAAVSRGPPRYTTRQRVQGKNPEHWSRVSVGALYSLHSGARYKHGERAVTVTAKFKCILKKYIFL